MNADEAKKTSLEDILLKFGFKPIEKKHGGNELWYISPFRNEATASFKIDVRKNVWYDHGEGKGGTAIDLVMKVMGTDVKGALAFLDKEFGKAKSTTNKDLKTGDLFATKKQEDKTESFILKEVKIFPSGHTGNALSRYITQERGIDTCLASKFLKEIHYSTAQDGKHFFAAGLENTKGGYEIRNPYFKGTVPENTKSISLVKTTEGNRKIVCFEGMLDFLSYGTLLGLKKDENYLILNSVSFTEKAAEMIKKGAYSSIKTFFDNDTAGQKATEFFKSEFPFAEPQNAVYAQKKDLNEFIMELKKTEIKRG